MSIGFLLANSDDPVIWRGPKKNGIFLINAIVDSLISSYCIDFIGSNDQAVPYRRLLAGY